MAATFRDEFCAALAESYFTCRKYVTEDGLSLENKKIAIECSVNLMVDMIARLPTLERDLVLAAVTSKLPSYVATAVSEKEISP